MTRPAWLTCFDSVVGAIALAACTFLGAGCTARNVLGYGDAGSDPGATESDAKVGLDAPGPDVYVGLDAPTVVDTRGLDGIIQVGPSYACGPLDGGVRCSCGLEPYFPAPVNANGEQQTYVLMPDPTTVVGYSTLAEFDALAVGRWQRTAGQGELICEQYGLDFTADHRVIPLVIASDGTVQEVTAQAHIFGLDFTGRTTFNTDTLSTNPPIFFDGGQSMYFNYSPWPADYARVAGP